MANLDVEKKSNNDWWKWLLAVLAIIALLWFIFDNDGDDDEIEEIDTTAYIISPPEAETEDIHSAKF